MSQRCHATALERTIAAYGLDKKSWRCSCAKTKQKSCLSSFVFCQKQLRFPPEGRWSSELMWTELNSIKRQNTVASFSTAVQNYRERWHIQLWLTKTRRIRNAMQDQVEKEDQHLPPQLSLPRQHLVSGSKSLQSRFSKSFGAIKKVIRGVEGAPRWEHAKPDVNSETQRNVNNINISLSLFFYQYRTTEINT